MESVSLQTRISDAKTFLLENPDERTACAAQIFKIRPTTLYSSIATDKKSSFSDMKSSSNKKSSSSAKSARGGQNKILEEHQVKAIHHFIRSLLAQGIQPSHGVVFNAIVGLKRGQNPESSGPTLRWFRTWWKKNNLHKIKTKPLAMIQFTAAQEKDIQAWFVDYRQALKTLQIKTKKNIVNFDEAGFRVGCMKGHQILAPTDVLEVRFYILIHLFSKLNIYFSSMR